MASSDLINALDCALNSHYLAQVVADACDGTTAIDTTTVVASEYVFGTAVYGNALVVQDLLDVACFTFLPSNLTIANSVNIVLGTGAGTKIGTAATQKIGFFNATPVVQQTVVADPSGGATQDAEARTAIAAINTRLKNLGLLASS